MNTNYGFSNSFLNKYDFGGYSAGTFNWASGSYAKNENTDITIITDDGDRVTISSEKRTESTYSSYSSLLRSGSASFQTEGYEYRSELRSSFSMSIAGDLDSEEYDDIISALKTIDKFMESASSGNVEDLQALAENFGSLDSLSALSADIKVEESAAYEQGQAVAAKEKESKEENSEKVRDAEKLEHVLSRLMKPGKRYGNVKQLMNDYLSGLMDSYSEELNKKHYNHEAAEWMKDMIMKSLVAETEEKEAAGENVPVESVQENSGLNPV